VRELRAWKSLDTGVDTQGGLRRAVRRRASEQGADAQRRQRTVLGVHCDRRLLERRAPDARLSRVSCQGCAWWGMERGL